MPIKFDLIGIITADMAESIRFYRLLDVPVMDPAPGEDHHESVLPNGLRIAWDTTTLMKELDPSWVDPTGQRLGLCFLCESPGAVDATYAKVIEAGFEGKMAPWDAFWGQRYAVIVDPDGNDVSLFAPL